jgi:hypothetical protein
MSDITTVDEVQAGDYTVRVAQTDDGTAWEAVVLSEDSGGSAPSHGMAGMLLTMHGPGGGRRSDDSASDDGPLGPAVTAPHKWVAVGFAIEALEWREAGETPVDVADGYRAFESDATLTLTDADGDTEDIPLSDADLRLDPDTKRALSSHATTFSGSWGPSGGDDNGE